MMKETRVVMDVYHIKVGEGIRSLEDLKEQFIIIVNIASECGFNTQLEALNQLSHNDAFKATVIAFPCRQFGQQNIPDEQMPEWCQINHKTEYLIEQTVDVNGEKAHPLFQYLKQKAPGILGEDIRWNFTKFVISPNESQIKRFAPQTSIQKIEKYILSQI